MPKQFLSQYLPYSETGKFSKIILDYISQAEQLTAFFSQPPTIDGIKEAIKQRQNFTTDRNLLVKVLEKQYAGIEASPEVKKNIELLSSTNTFTVCTAHQPNIFTGHLYFIYKILHTIKLAEYLQAFAGDNYFVPVFYMGSEDADLEELGHVYLNGQKYVWETTQTGAVGKMQVDENLIEIIDRISGQLSTLPFGADLIQLLKRCYVKGINVQQATFHLLNNLFQAYGLIVLVPDNADLKQLMQAIFEDDIFNNVPSAIVDKSSDELGKFYKVQAQPREINLFYFKDNIRNRLVRKKDIYYVENTGIQFTEAEIRSELKLHPEHFSPNVILRGLYQEIILPNLVFVGGGGELAYWLELKDLFQHYKVPYPLLLLRNSFLVVNKKAKLLAEKLKISTTDFFKDETLLINELVKKESSHQLYLTLEKRQLVEVFEEIKKTVQGIDTTLQPHTEALLTGMLKKLEVLEHKMLKAEKRKFETEQRQVKKLKSALFPNGGLQERVENFMPYYAGYGDDFIKMLYENSLIFEQNFCVLTEHMR